MRYGKSAGVTDLDETVRRKPGQSLKSAAPGAPFGWTSEGAPYIGTQYCVKGSKSGLKFASLSTRNGGAQYYWKDLGSLSKKVALSALETHGAVENLLAGESGLPCGDCLDPADLAAVKTVFTRLVGAETLRQFELSAKAEPETKVEAKAEAAAAVKAEPTKTTPPGKAEAEEAAAMVGEGSKVGEKRKARMELNDAIKADDAVASAVKRGHSTKSELEAMRGGKTAEGAKSELVD